ncbi:hypothetical protein [Lacinutrix himadriensis]|nr:hypothetical protein [Lacinutrix himadriensis]
MNFKFLNKVLSIALAMIAICFVACSSDDDNTTTEADTTVEPLSM